MRADCATFGRVGSGWSSQRRELRFGWLERRRTAAGSSAAPQQPFFYCSVACARRHISRQLALARARVFAALLTTTFADNNNKKWRKNEISAYERVASNRRRRRRNEAATCRFFLFSFAHLSWRSRTIERVARHSGGGGSDDDDGEVQQRRWRRSVKSARRPPSDSRFHVSGRRPLASSLSQLAVEMPNDDALQFARSCARGVADDDDDDDDGDDARAS